MATVDPAFVGWLTSDEVAELTDAKTWKVQARHLAKMGIPFVPSYAGRPLVERAAVMKHAAKPVKTAKQQQPNWEAMRHGQKAKD